MRKLTWIFSLSLLLLALPASAQETPQFELFGGYSFARVDFSGDSSPQSPFNLNGWNGAITENLNSWFGGTADFSGWYAHPSGTNVNAHTFLFGPHFAYRKSGAFTPFAHVLLGGIRASRGYLDISESATKFAAAFGGGVDIKIHKHVAIRVIQADYVVTPFLGLRQDNMRLSAGVVFRFHNR